MTDRRLKKELLEQGASTNEAENLARLAGQLAAAKPRGLSARAKQRIYDELPIGAPKKRRPVFRWAFAGSLAAATALLALLILPGMLQPKTAPTDEKDVRSLVQPVETELQELDMQIEELQQQPTVNEAELKEAEKKYERTLERLKNNYQNRKEFKNYDWNKWLRDWQNRNSKRDSSDDRDTERNTDRYFNRDYR